VPCPQRGPLTALASCEGLAYLARHIIGILAHHVVPLCPLPVTADTSHPGLADIACHVIGRHSTQDMRVHHASDEVVSNICLTLHWGGTGVLRVPAVRVPEGPRDAQGHGGRGRRREVKLETSPCDVSVILVETNLQIAATSCGVRFFVICTGFLLSS